MFTFILKYIINRLVNPALGGRMPFRLLDRRIFVALAAWLLLAPLARAQTELRILPVTLQGYVQGEIRVQVSLPCGSRYYGLLAAVHRDVIEVAAAVLQEAVSCTTMPETVAVRVDFLASSSFRSIAPLAVREGQRIRMVPVEQLQRTVGRKVLAVYTSRCGQHLGVLVHRVGAMRLELGMAEAIPEHRLGATCSSPAKLLSLPALAVPERLQLAPLHAIEPGLKRRFTLRLASIDPSKTTNTAASGLTLLYQRRCNEAPIGMVLGPWSGHPGHAGEVLQIGVLVAAYPSLRCSEASPQATWQTLNEPALRLPLGVTMAALEYENVAAQGLRLRVPSKLSLKSNTTLQTLQINYFAACEPGFAVYSRDRQGVLAVGVLGLAPSAQMQESGGSRCKKVLSEVSLHQPFVASGVQAAELYPMRIKGQ